MTQLSETMSKTSANPRKYSRGAEFLNPEQDLSVYMALYLNQDDIKPTIGRIEYLGKKHREAQWRVVEIQKEDIETRIIVEVTMGPAREALHGEHPQTLAGYALIWDIAKVLFYASPVFCSPPQLGEVEKKKAAEAFAKAQSLKSDSPFI